MTMTAVCERPTFHRCVEGKEDPAKRSWRDRQTWIRWHEMRVNAVERRRRALRAANRRYRIHNGLTLKGA